MKKLGFGCMRLPLLENGEVDLDQFNEMVDLFLKEGFTYFDTAHGYLDGKSELALKSCLTSRYPRDAYTITNKLTDCYFHSQEEIRPFFLSQLEACGVTYFDYYLMHAQTSDSYAHFQKNHAYETCLEFLKEGKIKHFGISFHDTPELLEQILTEHPEVEFVQIQFNYADYESASVQSKKVYEVAVKHNKKVLVMEPVKGGTLAKLPEEGNRIIEALGGGSPASYAIRFAASFPSMYMVLSGMSTLEQAKDNISFMKDFKPLNKEEEEAVFKIAAIFNKQGLIPCTGCRYCVAGCPRKILIPNLFSCLNTKEVFHDWNANFYYSIYTKDNGLASSCLKCGKCEAACPQHLPIRKLLEHVADVFEK